MTVKWSEGIRPRTFRWVISDRLAVSERPGGHGINHRSVRRREEIIWLSRNGISTILTLTTAPYNLHDYREHSLDYIHLPFSGPDDGSDRLEEILHTIHKQMTPGQLLIHQGSIGDALSGVIGGYLLWSGLVEGGPNAVTLTERLLEREMGPPARETVGMAERLPPPPPPETPPKD